MHRRFDSNSSQEARLHARSVRRTVEFKCGRRERTGRANSQREQRETLPCPGRNFRRRRCLRRVRPQNILCPLCLEPFGVALQFPSCSPLRLTLYYQITFVRCRRIFPSPPPAPHPALPLHRTAQSAPTPSPRPCHVCTNLPVVFFVPQR